MRTIKPYVATILYCSMASVLCSCSYYTGSDHYGYSQRAYHVRSEADFPAANYEARLPQHINTKERTIVVDPNVHAWGAYNAQGNLVRGGVAVAGSNWCPDIGRPCRTHAGTYHIQSLGSPACKSHKFPLPRGGAPMPYCMFFNGGQGLHGTSPSNLAEANLSHGCVRMRTSDAAWVRYSFAGVGTKVIVRPY